MIPIKPKDVTWTDEQWSAIYEDGKNILVSAGAGSGKTAVLTQRVIAKLKNGVSLRNLIILTFTNAAALEMKVRIRKELRKEILRGDNPHLKEEYDYIDQANIQTFDGFALEIVKKYHYLLNVDRNISIIDSAMLDVKKIEFVDIIFNNHYQSNDTIFMNMIKDYCVKNDKNIKKYIININDGLDLLTDRKSYLHNYSDNYFSQTFIEKIKKDYLEYISLIIKNIKDIDNGLRGLFDNKKTNEYLERLHESLISLYKVDSYEKLINLELKMPSVPGSLAKEEKDIISSEKKIITGEINKLKGLITYQTLDEKINKALENKEYIIKIIELCNELDSMLLDYKKSLSLYSFMDIAKMAIVLFEENDDIRSEYHKNINEILVDEYQDTSDIQERLVSLISNGKNVYMVGDVKQSIYRFRNANPSIFINKYNRFKQEDNDDLVIDLSKNFRSRKEVLNSINLLFKNVMNLSYGGADYNNGHALIFGNNKYENYKDHNNDFEIYSYSVSKEDTTLSTPEVEAMIIAKDIKNKIESGYKVLKGDELVNASYGDFAVLTQNKTHFDLFKKVFESYNIPLFIHKDSVFSSSYEIIALVNTIKAINYVSKHNYQDDFRFSFASFLRSFLVDISEYAFSEIFLSDNPLMALKELYEEVYNKIMYLAKIKEDVTLTAFIDRIFNVFDVYGNIYKLDNVESVENNLDYFLTKASELSKLGFSLDEFIVYFDNVDENDIEIELSSKVSASSNFVNMLTIHKSKGLEYNVCYFPLISSHFILHELNDMILFDKEYGIILPVINEGIEDSILKELFASRLHKEEISEKIRLLYVALTRAKDKFIIISKPFENGNGELDYTDYKKSMFKSLYGIIASSRSLFNFYIKDVFFEENKLYKVKSYKRISDIDASIIIDENIFEENSNWILEKGHASASLNYVIDKDIKDRLQVGTEIHKYLEMISYDNYENDINGLNTSNFIKNKVLSFYENLKNLIHKIKNIYHEYQFIYFNEGTEINGIIDMLVETDDSYIIIDYKLSDTSKDEYYNQLMTYKKYISNISNKKVKMYLYSIMKEEFNEVI